MPSKVVQERMGVHTYGHLFSRADDADEISPVLMLRRPRHSFALFSAYATLRRNSKEYPAFQNRLKNRLNFDN
ncbi:hypothetical protein [Mesorhizobium sp. 8]|uniref:hypothetical protein n=1 Tax=Mesorhizobium sp. 8 TaxID=2584466 RepID=UPI001123803C|nr:hypothetical protein [Mesorhizobium sp. 8]QDC02671.1 hypothetical protein FGU64_20820 [Mesorhizobium sp. 8]